MAAEVSTTDLDLAGLHFAVAEGLDCARIARISARVRSARFAELEAVCARVSAGERERCLSTGDVLPLEEFVALSDDEKHRWGLAHAVRRGQSAAFERPASAVAPTAADDDADAWASDLAAVRRLEGGLHFNLVRERSVAPSQRRFAAAVRDAAAADLGCAPPRIRWFTRSSFARWSDGFKMESSAWGFVLPSAAPIFVLVELRHAELAEAVAHEVFHKADVLGSEDEARRYGRRWRDRDQVAA